MPRNHIIIPLRACLPLTHRRSVNRSQVAPAESAGARLDEDFTWPWGGHGDGADGDLAEAGEVDACQVAN